MGLREDIFDMKKEIREVKEQSLAMEMLKDSKRANTRIAVAFASVLIVVSIFWFLTLAYLIHTLNDIGNTTETITQENAGGSNNYIGNDGNINYGETNDN